MNMLTSMWAISFLALIINLGVVAGTFFRHKKDFVAIAEKAAAAQHAEHEEPKLAPMEPGYWSLQFAEFEQMVESVKRTREELAERETALDSREARLANEREQLDAMMESVRAERASLDDILFHIEDHERANLAFLASTYASMEPTAVVPVWQKMPDEQVIKLVLQMKPDVVAPIFAAMIARDDVEQSQSRRVARIAQEIRRYRRPNLPEAS